MERLTYSRGPALLLVTLFSVGILRGRLVAQPYEFAGRIPSGQRWYFNNPSGIAIHEDGTIYVADYGNNRIQKFDRRGTLLTSWTNTGSTRTLYPAGIALDAQGHVYVADDLGDCIRIFDATGAIITVWGANGRGEGEFHQPKGVAIDDQGFLYVTDRYNFRVQKFDTTGSFITTWGGLGDGAGEFYHPHGIAVDARGYVYVSDGCHMFCEDDVCWDECTSRVQKFDSDGQYITEWGGEGTGPGQFKEPYGVAVDEADFVYVTD